MMDWTYEVLCKLGNLLIRIGRSLLSDLDLCVLLCTAVLWGESLGDLGAFGAVNNTRPTWTTLQIQLCVSQ